MDLSQEPEINVPFNKYTKAPTGHVGPLKINTLEKVVELKINILLLKSPAAKRTFK